MLWHVFEKLFKGGGLSPLIADTESIIPALEAPRYTTPIIT